MNTKRSCPQKAHSGVDRVDSPLISVSHYWRCELLRNRSQGVSSCRSWCAQDHAQEHVCLMFTPSILPSSLYSFLLEMECDFVSEIGLELGAQVVFLLHSAFWAVGTVGTFHYPSCSCCFLNESWRLGDPAMGLTYFRVKRSWLCYLTLDNSGQLVHISGREGGAGKLVGLGSL